MNDVLTTLGIQSENIGAGTGQGEWFASSDTKLSSINPSTNQVLATIKLCQQQDYEKIVTVASEAFLKWRTVPAPKRGEIIHQVGVLLREYKDALGTLVSLEMGKSIQEGKGEVQEMIDMADFAVGESRMLYGKTMHSERPEHRMYEQWHPYGVVGVVSAFNFPVAVWAWNAFIAAICGNTVIWKPSSKTPLCAVAVQQICNRVLAANHCPAIFNFFIPHDHAISNNFLNDKRVPLISFTGSTNTGRHVAEVVSKRLGRTILELGGNNAVIVDESADLKLAIPAIVFGAVGTAGQRCTSTRRVFVHESIYEKVLAALKNAYQQIKIGDPLNEKNLMGPLIDQDAVTIYQSALTAIQKAGGDIAFGGHVLPSYGFYVEPTLITGAENDWPIVQEETFAPILYVMSYKTFEQALAMHNGVSQGLTSALFTNDLRRAEYFLSSIGSDCGIANINIGTSGAEIGGAFGGEKDTGGGRESGSDAWQAYMRRQTNTINWSHELPLAQGIKFISS